MNKEIKEILSLLNSSSWSNEARQIEDYITNLEQKNQVLKYENTTIRDVYKNQLEYANKQQAHNEIFELIRRLNIMQVAFRMLVTGIKDDYIDVVVDTAIPEARFFTGKRDFANIDYTTVKMIKVPLKDNLMRDLARIYNQIGGDDNEC